MSSNHHERGAADMRLSEEYERACAEAARLYAAGEDTAEIDRYCDELQAAIEKGGE